jgi:hypothetical protein
MLFFQYKTPLDAFIGTMKHFLSNKSGKDSDVIIEVDDCRENLPLTPPYESDSVFWLLREVSDWVVGQKAPGGLHLRYDARRYRYVKRNGIIDWGYKDSTGEDINTLSPKKTMEYRRAMYMASLHQSEINEGRIAAEHIPSYEDMEVQFQELFNRLGENPSEVAGRIEGDGQLQYVKEMLISDRSTDKAILNFWRWKKDLAEYYHRRYLSEEYTDPIHQRTTCGLLANFSVRKGFIDTRFTIRHSVVYQHFTSDLFRPTEIARYLGRYINKEVGRFLLSAWNMRQIYYRSNRAFWEYTINHHEQVPPLSVYYPVFPTEENHGDQKFWDMQFDLKEQAELLYRTGAFEDGDKVSNSLTPYYRTWAKAMKIAEMLISKDVIDDLIKGKITPPNAKKTMEYLDSRNQGYLPVVLEFHQLPDVALKPLVGSHLIKYFLKNEQYDDAVMVMSLLKPEVQQVVLTQAIFNGGKKIKDDLKANRLSKSPYNYIDDYYYNWILTEEQ